MQLDILISCGTYYCSYYIWITITTIPSSECAKK